MDYVAAGIAFDSALILNTCKLQVHTQIEYTNTFTSSVIYIVLHLIVQIAYAYPMADYQPQFGSVSPALCVRENISNF